jgi:hypothetical protein
MSSHIPSMFVEAPLCCRSTTFTLACSCRNLLHACLYSVHSCRNLLPRFSYDMGSRDTWHSGLRVFVGFLKRFVCLKTLVDRELPVPTCLSLQPDHFIPVASDSLPAFNCYVTALLIPPQLPSILPPNKRRIYLFFPHLSSSLTFHLFDCEI